MSWSDDEDSHLEWASCRHRGDHASRINWDYKTLDYESRGRGFESSQARHSVINYNPR
jgi:hypothetical protein